MVGGGWGGALACVRMCDTRAFVRMSHVCVWGGGGGGVHLFVHFYFLFFHLCCLNNMCVKEPVSV